MTDSELVGEQQQVQADLLAIRREIRNEQQRCRRQLARSSQCRGSQRLLHEAVATYCLSGYDLATAQVYMQVRGGLEMSVDQGRLIEDTFLIWPIDDIVKLSFPTTDQEDVLRRKVLTFLAEKNTVAWVSTQNEDHGFAPSPAETFAEYCRLLGDLAPHEPSSRRAQKIIRLLRLRWHVSFRKYEPHDDSTTEERSIMVCTSIHFCLFCNSFCFYPRPDY